MPSIRTFVAFETPEAIRREMHTVQSEIKKTGADVKWESEKKFHATIKFLGNVEGSALPSILTAIGTAVQKCQPFEVVYQTIGAFPTINHPRVIWVGCENRDGTLKNLKNELDTLLLPFGFEKDDRPFHPHVTLGRAKGISGIKNLTSILEKINFNTRIALINEIVVMKSVLRPEGSEYSILKSIPLK